MRPPKITLILTLILCVTTVVNAKIVFTKYIHLSTKIFVMDDDGTNVTQITDGEASEKRPRWSPDGTQIAFFRDTDPTSRIRDNTFIMNADAQMSVDSHSMMAMIDTYRSRLMAKNSPSVGHPLQVCQQMREFISLILKVAIPNISQKWKLTELTGHRMAT